MHHAQHFSVVTCPAVLLNQVQEEAFQIQLFDLISFLDSSQQSKQRRLGLPRDVPIILMHNYLPYSHICGSQKQSRGHANLKWSASYRTWTVQEARPGVHALFGDPIVLIS
jgi:hypothetical protein